MRVNNSDKGVYVFKITIIIPITDIEEYLETFECIKNQTIGFENLQVIFVNSASDNIVNDYPMIYPNVISVELNDINPTNGKLYNIGMKHSVCDYMMFLNPSDRLMENTCKSLYDEILKKDYDIVCGANIDRDIYEKTNLSFDSHETKNFIIKNLNACVNLFKKSFIAKNNLRFIENCPESDDSFLFNALLNTDEIKLINSEIVKHPTHQDPSKEMLKGFLDETFEMYYSSCSNDENQLFKDNILLDRLNYFINEYLFKCNLAANDLLDLLIYSNPLFDLLKQNLSISCDDLPALFKYIIHGKYEDALYLIYGEDLPKQNEIKIAALCDSKTYDSFKFECDLIKLIPDDWLNQLKNEKPNLFLLTSSYCEDFNEEKLPEILEYCSKNGIPSIFWENSAFKQKDHKRLMFNFDYIFTAYKENADYYCINDCDNVEYLMFATQPKLFNPINECPKLKKSVAFIGTWDKGDSKQCELISKNLNEIIANNYKLRIFDYDSINDLNNTTFPVRYHNYMDIAESHSQIPKIYNESERGLVINEDENIIDGNIFELMSSNTLVYSNYREILYREFKNNVIYSDCSNNPDGMGLKKIKRENLHNVLKNHTYSNRLKQILDTINIKYSPNIKRITLFYRLKDLNEIENIYNHFYSIEYPYKQMKIIATEDLLYLPNTILENQLSEIKLDENDYFSFVDLNSDSDFIEEALLHFSYIEKDTGIKEDIDNSFSFDKTHDIGNVIFNGSQYENVISENRKTFDIYKFNNFKTKVSVIVSVYNGEKYLRKCLDSVVDQTLKDIEIICIDNGSYDSSFDIIKEYAQNDSRIKIVTQINSGRGNSMNAGLEMAKGKYVYFIDSDTYMELNGLNEMYQQAELKNLDLLKFNLMTYNDENDLSGFENSIDPKLLKGFEDVAFDYKKIGSNAYKLSPSMESLFFRTKTIKNLKFPKLKFEDNVFFIEALFNSKRVYYCNKSLANKREKEYSILELPGHDFADIIEIRNQIADLAKRYNHYEGYEFIIYSRKYRQIQCLFLQTFENYKERFFEKIKEDCMNKKEEYENEKIFEILDDKSIKIFNAGLNSKDYKEFENIISNL